MAFNIEELSVEVVELTNATQDLSDRLGRFTEVFDSRLGKLTDMVDGMLSRKDILWEKVKEIVREIVK